MVVVALVIRFWVAVVFLRAGALKVLDMEGFRAAVRNYELVPQGFVPSAALAVPVAELACGGLLLVGVGTGPVAAAVVVLLAVFSTAVAVNLLRGRRISCGCSGRVASDITWRHVASNVLLASAAVVVSLWAVQPLSVVGVWGVDRRAGLGGAAAVAVLLAAGAAGSAALLVREALRVRRAVPKASPRRAVAAEVTP